MTPSFKRSLSTYKRFKSSLLVGLMINMASLYAPMLNAAPIYKVIDEKTGQVTFTDNPQSYEQQANNQITQTGITTGNSTSADSNRTSTLSGSNDNQSKSTDSNSASAPNTQPATVLQEAATPIVNYQLTMTEPSKARAYRRPAQSINVNIQIKPALQVGDSVSIYLDGNEVAQGLSASIPTVDVLPGEHSVQAVVKSKKGQALKQISRTIYVIQNTQTLQNNKKIAEQLLAYQRLPWHQKVLLKLHQDGKQLNMQSLTKPIADKPMTLEQPVIK